MDIFRVGRSGISGIKEETHYFCKFVTLVDHHFNQCENIPTPQPKRTLPILSPTSFLTIYVSFAKKVFLLASFSCSSMELKQTRPQCSDDPHNTCPTPCQERVLWSRQKSRLGLSLVQEEKKCYFHHAAMSTRQLLMN